MTLDFAVTAAPQTQRTIVVTPAPTQQVSVAQPGQTNVISASTERVDVQQLGIIGPQGPQGPPGTSEATVYPVNAISSWYQAHTFPYPPEVRLIDADGDAVESGVEYPDQNHVYIEFPAPFTGRIILS